MSSGSFLQKLITLAAGRGFVPAPLPLAQPPRRILVVRLNRLGDLICALPLYRTLELNWPKARIDWLLSSQNAVLTPFIRPAGEVHILPKNAARYWIPRTVLRALQDAHYDLVLAVKGGFDSRLAWVCLASGAAERIGFRPERPHWLDRAWTQPLPPPASHQHQVEKGLHLLDPFGFGRRSDDISLEVPQAARERARGFLDRIGIRPNAPFALFQISSTKRSFCQWPHEHFVALGQMMTVQAVPVLINALPGEQATAERICKQIGPGADPAIFSDLADYLACLANARVVVGADGGGIHLAAAMGSHTVAFYAESHPVKWRPWQGEHLQFYTANRDLREVTPEEVWRKLSETGWLGERLKVKG